MTPTSAGEWIIFLAAVITAAGIVWRKALRPGWRTLRAAIAKLRRVHDVIERELNHNGGSSIKDQVLATVQRLDSAARQLEELRRNDDAMTEVLDHLARAKGKEHAAIWDALHDLGIDRRHEGEQP